MPETRSDRLLRRLRNHPVLAGLIVLGVAIVGIGAVVSALDNMRRVVTPARRVEVAMVRIGRAHVITAFEVTVLNGTDNPSLVKHFRLALSAKDTLFVRSENSGSMNCAPGPTFFLADSVRFERGGTFRGSVAESGDNVAFPTFGWFHVECGGMHKELVVEFDASVELPPRASTSLSIHLPRTLRVDTDSFVTRFEASTRHHPSLLGSDYLYSYRTPRQIRAIPRDVLARSPIHVDSVLEMGAITKRWQRQVTVSLLLTTGRISHTASLD